MLFHIIKIGESMTNFLLPFTLTLIAGLSTLIGTFFIFIKYDINKLTKYSLAFASGVMVSVSLLDLIPESLELLLKDNLKNQSFIFIIISIIAGIIISYLIDKIIPENKNVKNKKLYRVGIFSMIAIIVHNVPEGIATFLSSTSNLSLGIILTIAIALHNVPEGISISVPVYTSTNSKSRAVGYTLISALAEPLGAILAYLFLKPIITNTIMGIILSTIAGIMLHIGIFSLLPAALKYKEKTKTCVFFIVGFIFMIISNLLMSKF